MQNKINSKEYWEKRFASGDWEEKGGSEQTAYFYNLLCELLPSYLKNAFNASDKCYSICDVGCAEGDGTSIISENFYNASVSGVDISESAIEKARIKYPDCDFKISLTDTYDIVVSSNVLEHFTDPFNHLQELFSHSSQYVVILVPFEENERIEEHFYTFFYKDFKLEFNDYHLVYVNYQYSDKTFWQGKQHLFVYQKDADLSKMTLELFGLQALMNNAELGIDEQIVDLNNQIVGLNNTVSDRDEQIANLNNTVSDCDEQIANLTNRIADIDRNITAIKKSVSWRLTRPLRFIKYFIQSPMRSSYDLVKFIYWWLPPEARQALHGPKHKFVRIMNGKRGSLVVFSPRSRLGDLNWSEFSDQVLSKRSKYLGVFVQELAIAWDIPLFQRPQHMATALGKLGYLVIYRTDALSGDDVEGFRQVKKNVWITNRDEVSSINNVVRSVYSTDFTKTPELLMANGRRGLMIYEYIDHIDPQISGDDENIKRLLELKRFAFEGGADYIIASASKLYNEAVSAVGEEKVILVPNGVDCRHYRSSVHESISLPSKYLKFVSEHKTIVGYFGALAPWLWYEVIEQLVESRPDTGFVFIGPDYYGGLSKLPTADNLLYLGVVDYNILPGYAKLFDVCFIPFKPGEISRTTSPLKLFEYFALEKPVVVTSEMSECTAYREVLSGGNVESLSAAIDEAIELKVDSSFLLQLRQLADINSWDERAKSMEVVFESLPVVPSNQHVDY